MSEDDAVGDYERSVLSEMFVGRRGRLRTYAFELATAVGYPFVGVSFLVHPDELVHSVVGREVAPWDAVWSVLWITGGLLVAAGVLRPELRLRAVGLIAVGTGLVMEVVAAVTFDVDIRIGFSAVFALACFLRATLIVRLYRRFNVGGSPGESGSAAGV